MVECLSVGGPYLVMESLVCMGLRLYTFFAAEKSLKSTLLPTLLVVPSTRLAISQHEMKAIR